MATIGVQSAVFVDGNDVSEMLNTASVASPMGTFDVTTFRPQNFTRNFNAGLQTKTISLKGFLPVDAATAAQMLENTIGNRSGQDVLIGVGGLNLGNLAIFAKSLKGESGADVMADGIMAVHADFQVTTASPGALNGLVLSTPHGTTALQQNEAQTLTFTNVPAGQLFAFRKAGSSTLSAAWSAGDGNSTLDTALESLYGSGTLTVTGSLTTSTDGTTGETLYSGTLTLVYAGSDAHTDVPQVEVVTGEAHRYIVAGGDSDADYGYAGSSGLALGTTMSAALFQAAIRGVGGNYAAANVGGSSTAPVAGTPSIPVFDAQTVATEASGATTCAASHTTSGSNRYMRVFAILHGPTSAAFTGATYNGVALTQRKLSSSINNSIYAIYDLVAPAVGTHNVVLSADSNANFGFYVQTFTNVDQVTPLDVAIAETVSVGSSISHSITTATANSLLVDDLGFGNNGPESAGSGQTEISSTTYTASSTKAATTAGTYAMAWSITYAADYGHWISALRGYSAPASAGIAAFGIYLPPSVGNIALPSVTGTGATRSSLEDGGSLAAHVAPTTTIPGSSSAAIYNPVTATGNGTPVKDGDVDTAFGAIALLQCISALGSGKTLSVKIQHAPDVDGSPGSWADLQAFDDVTAKGAQRKTIAAGTTIHPHLRAVVTAVTGTFVYAVAFARFQS